MTRVGVGQCISETMKITFIFSICKEVSFSTRLLSALLTAAVVGVKRETVGATGFSSPLEMGMRSAHTHQFCKLLLMETQTQIFKAIKLNVALLGDLDGSRASDTAILAESRPVVPGGPKNNDKARKWRPERLTN